VRARARAPPAARRLPSSLFHFFLFHAPLLLLLLAPAAPARWALLPTTKTKKLTHKSPPELNKLTP